MRMEGVRLGPGDQVYARAAHKARWCAHQRKAWGSGRVLLEGRVGWWVLLLSVGRCLEKHRSPHA